MTDALASSGSGDLPQPNGNILAQPGAADVSLTEIAGTAGSVVGSAVVLDALPLSSLYSDFRRHDVDTRPQDVVVDDGLVRWDAGI